MADVATREEGAVARPLKVLVPLIKEDFEAAEKAGMPYYIKAGKKLNEARYGHYRDDVSGFYDWTDEHFGKSRNTIRTYMALGAEADPKAFKSLEDFKHKTSGHPTRAQRRGGPDKPRPVWTEPVSADAKRAREEQRRLYEQEALTRQQERQAEIKLGQRLIAIGYKVLAKELHPDKMSGSREAMARLNRVRERLKAHV